MKFRSIIFLFLFFTACLSAVKFTDGYSQRYNVCAANWVKAAKLTKDNPLLRSALRDAVLGQKDAERSDQSCPVLTRKHRDDILAYLDS